jgi:hypothetical protein
MTDLTSVQAAALLGVDRVTAQKAARAGKVEGAKQEPRPGAINPPWVATEHAWRTWHENRRPAGRPPKEDTPVFEKPDDKSAYEKLIAMNLDPRTTRRITRMIGTHEYHMEDRQDLMDSVNFVRNDLKRCSLSGWAAGCLEQGEAWPANAIQVGFVDTWGGKRHTPLYIYPTDTGDR